MKAKHIVGMSVLILGSVTGFAEEVKKVAPEARAEKVAMPTQAKILHKMKVKKLEIELQRTPTYSFNGASSKKASKDQKWLEIEALIDVTTLSKKEFLPSLDATFTLVYKNKPKKVYSKIERTITFKNVNIEDGKIYVVAYLDPDTLGVITGEKRPSVKDLTGVAISIHTDHLSTKNPKDLRKSELFDRKLALKEDNAWWKSSNITASEQKLLAYNETPFELARPERYPLVVKK